MEIWYKELGFYNNPFSIKPAMYTDELYGYNLGMILDKISRGEVLFLEGAYGKGKTTILKRIIREFGGGRNLVYYSCNRTEKNIDFDELLKGKYGLLGNLFNMKGENMILLLDEAQHLNEEDSNTLIQFSQ